MHILFELELVMEIIALFLFLCGEQKNPDSLNEIELLINVGFNI